MTERHRAYCFTLNNYTMSDEFCCSMISKKAIYMIVGKETCPTTGTPHLQGFIRLKNAMTFNNIKSALPRAHIVVANGSDAENKAYCSKENNILIETGTPSEGQGKRTDLKEIAQLIKNKQVSIEDIMFDYPDMYLRYSRSFEKMFNAVLVPRSEPPKVFWRWGLAGLGKTRYCIDNHPSHFIKDGTMWWDGYNQQEAIIIDDFDNQIPYRTLLRMLDRYQYQGQVKGGYVQINSPYIYITCEYPPTTYWADNELAQITRRLTSVEQIK